MNGVSLISRMLGQLARFESWMDGTVVTLSQDGKILQYLTRRDFCFEDIKDYHKTVNI